MIRRHMPIRVRHALMLACSLLVAGCDGDDGGGSFACTYETRSTGCGGSGWSEWTTECYAFNLDDYKEGWTAERVCEKFGHSDTACSATCCINIEYRNNKVASGSCP